MEKENKSKKFWDYALLVVGGILILIPLLYTFLSSFKTTKQIMEHFFAWPHPWTMANYQRLFADGVAHYFWNSIVITVLSVALVMIFVPMAAYSIARNMSKRTAFNWMYILLLIGIFVPFQVIMILYLTYAIPQTLFLYVSYIKQSVPESLDEAAELDGANKFTAYFKIIFPLLKPMHATTLIINAMWFWNDFMLPLLILNRDSKMWTLPLFQYNYTGQYFNDYGPSFASYVIGIITITIVYLIFQKNIIAGMSNGAVK